MRASLVNDVSAQCTTLLRQRIDVWTCGRARMRACGGVSGRVAACVWCLCVVPVCGACVWCLCVPVPCQGVEHIQRPLLCASMM